MSASKQSRTQRDYGMLTCHCGRRVAKRAPNQRVCPDCRRGKRGSNPKQTGSWAHYTPEQKQVHRALRRQYQQRMDMGESFTCWRCGEPIDPRRWDLGHDDHDRTIYRGPEHVKCNRATYKRKPPRRLIL